MKRIAATGRHASGFGAFIDGRLGRGRPLGTIRLAVQLIRAGLEEFELG